MSPLFHSFPKLLLRFVGRLDGDVAIGAPIRDKRLADQLGHGPLGSDRHQATVGALVQGVAVGVTGSPHPGPQGDAVPTVIGASGTFQASALGDLQLGALPAYPLQQALRELQALPHGFSSTARK